MLCSGEADPGFEVESRPPCRHGPPAPLLSGYATEKEVLSMTEEVNWLGWGRRKLGVGGGVEL